MIIWLDGTYGVGKTTVANKLKEKFTDNDFDILDSDEYFTNMSENFGLGGGCWPQNNKRFIVYFRQVIEDKLKNSNKDLIIVMALTQTECKEMLFEYLVNKYNNIKIWHIILVASKEEIISRINADAERDTTTALRLLQNNIYFLENNYSDAIRIDTNNKNVFDIASNIFDICM